MKKEKTEIGTPKKIKNREFAIIAYVFIFFFLVLAGYYVYFLAAKSDRFIDNPYNKRINSLSRFVSRGDIKSSDGKV
ncbi:MAG: penicillin-binding protein 2, partial [Lachnospiraceae bacterium]|nr:penicillin-binding protein 2 [Lachnospiraceae bacterium]